MSDSPRGYASRAFDFCVGALLAAMALYGAVWIIKSIWVWLCVIAAVVILAIVIWQILRVRF